MGMMCPERLELTVSSYPDSPLVLSCHQVIQIFMGLILFAFNKSLHWRFALTTFALTCLLIIIVIYILIQIGLQYF